MLPPLICCLPSKVRGIIFSAMQSNESLDVTGNLKANRELIFASPSEQAHAAFLRLQPLILSMDTFVSCSCWINLIVPLILVHEQQFLFVVGKHTLRKSVSLSIKANKEW